MFSENLGITKSKIKIMGQFHSSLYYLSKKVCDLFSTNQTTVERILDRLFSDNFYLEFLSTIVVGTGCIVAHMVSSASYDVNL